MHKPGHTHTFESSFISFKGLKTILGFLSHWQPKRGFRVSGDSTVAHWEVSPIAGLWGPDIVVLYFKVHVAPGRAGCMPQSAFISALGPLL